jgi:hypothetical protein
MEVFDNNNTRISYQKYEYDTNPLIPFVGPNPPTFTYCNDSYCSAITERGNLTKTKIYESVSDLSGEITSTMSYDNLGNLVSSKPEINSPIETQYKYTSDTAYAYPQEVVTGDLAANNPNQLKSIGTYNFNTGIPLTVTDANLQTAQFVHDPQTWRPIKTVAPYNEPQKLDS